jgi:hypothetical protein
MPPKQRLAAGIALGLAWYVFTHFRTLDTITGNTFRIQSYAFNVRTNNARQERHMPT